MGAFYGNKIQRGEINPKTEKAWELKDVPPLWRVKTEQWLESH